MLKTHNAACKLLTQAAVHTELGAGRMCGTEEAAGTSAPALPPSPWGLSLHVWDHFVVHGLRKEATSRPWTTPARGSLTDYTSPGKFPLLDGVQQETHTTSEQENKPSAEEQQELAVLNRALEKAMRIRNTVPLPLPGDLGKVEGAPDRNATSVANMITCPAPVPKEQASRIAAATPAVKLPPTKKLSGHTLQPPYRTSCERKRSHGPSVTAAQAPRSTKEAWRNHRREAAQHKVLQSSSKGHLEEQQVEGASVHTREWPPSDGATDRQLGDLQANVPGYTDAISSENQILSGVSGGCNVHACTLKELRHTLKLPITYGQESSKNEWLWEKVNLCQSNPLVVSETQFIQKMEAAFDSGNPAFSLAAVEAEVAVLRNAHTILRQRVVAEGSLESAGPLKLEKEYQRLLMLESIHAAVSQYLGQIQKLREAAEPHVSPDPDNLAASTSAPQVGWPRMGNPQSSNTRSLSTPLLVYFSVQELKEIEAQKLRLGHLQQQLNIQKVLMAELIPLLESRTQLGPSLALLYRALYTQLCEGGQKFPALVFDDLPD